MFPCRDSEVPVCEHHQSTMCACRVSCGEGAWLGCGSCMHVKNVGDTTQFRANVLFYFMVEWMRWKLRKVRELWQSYAASPGAGWGRAEKRM
jgi:hypothetical protein